MSKTVGKFFNSLSDFSIFEVAQASVKVSDLFLRILHEVADLFRSKTDSPEHSLISFHRERFIEHAQTIGILEGVEVFFHTRLDKRHRLRENLDQRSAPSRVVPRVKPNNDRRP